MSPVRLSTVIKHLMRDMTQAELAKKAHVTEAYISQLLKGKRKNPSLRILKRLARALGVPVAELLE
jgi:transcriptional regulator with XRE-family HTH domain